MSGIVQVQTEQHRDFLNPVFYSNQHSEDVWYVFLWVYAEGFSTSVTIYWLFWLSMGYLYFKFGH